MKYILDKNNIPVLTPDWLKWANWFETANPVVACEIIGKSTISTVFLGIIPSFDEGTEPMLWETMVFGGHLKQEKTRCGGSIEDAKLMHRNMVEKVKEDE